jgi:hypothetical protein
MVIKVPTYFKLLTDLKPEEVNQFKEQLEPLLAEHLIQLFPKKGHVTNFLDKKVTFIPIRYEEVKKVFSKKDPLPSVPTTSTGKGPIFC